MLQQDSIISQHAADPAISNLPADTALDAAYDQFLELDFSLHAAAPRTVEQALVLMPDSFALYRTHLDSALIEQTDVHRYLHDSFFEHDSIYRTEVSTPGYGVAGDPVPYTLRSDDMIGLLLLLCFVVFSVSLARSKHFIARQLKHFFNAPHDDDEPFAETSGELRFQLFLVLVGCLLIALAGYLFVKDRIAQTFVLANDFQLVGLLFGSTVAYYGTKGLLLTVVNNVFFGGKKNIQFLKDLLFLNAFVSVVIFPIVMLMIYFDFSVQNATYFFIFVLFFYGILTFYKLWAIFFRQKGGFLQTFLYFCTLEATPIFAYCGLMLALIDVLKINF